MKYCPSCRTNYADDTLQYCLQDGTQLAVGQSSPLPSDTPTVAIPSSSSSSWNEPETVVRPKASPHFNQESQVTRVSSLQPPPPAVQNAPPKSNTALPVLLTVFIMLLLFGGIIGAWILLKGRGTEGVIVTNTNAGNNSTPANTNKKASDDAATPTATATATSTPTATPAVNTEEIKRDVSDTIYGWKSAAESHNLNSYMNNYAGTINYYNSGGASREKVRGDKQRAFTTYDSMQITLSNMRVTPDASGENATAVFDKEWTFEGSDKYSEGKVQTQLRLTKSGDRWLITGEKDLKVYYVNK